MSRRQKSHGSFHDLERLLAELDRPPIMELGKPEPDVRFLPAPSGSRCPAEHNRMLFDEAED